MGQRCEFKDLDGSYLRKYLLMSPLSCSRWRVRETSSRDSQQDLLKNLFSTRILSCLVLTCFPFSLFLMICTGNDYGDYTARDSRLTVEKASLIGGPVVAVLFAVIFILLTLRKTSSEEKSEPNPGSLPGFVTTRGSRSCSCEGRQIIMTPILPPTASSGYLSAGQESLLFSRQDERKPSSSWMMNLENDEENKKKVLQEKQGSPQKDESQGKKRSPGTSRQDLTQTTLLTSHHRSLDHLDPVPPPHSVMKKTSQEETGQQTTQEEQHLSIISSSFPGFHATSSSSSQFFMDNNKYCSERSSHKNHYHEDYHAEKRRDWQRYYLEEQDYLQNYHMNHRKESHRESILMKLSCHPHRLPPPLLHPTKSSLAKLSFHNNHHHPSHCSSSSLHSVGHHLHPHRQEHRQDLLAYLPPQRF